MYFRVATLGQVLARRARHALMISLACGALAALALVSAAMWLVLGDELFILYAGMIALQALYLAYFSGEGFRWPWLAAGSALAPYAWDVPVALSGAMASLFAREIANLRHTSTRVYQAFGWMAAAFVALAVANVGWLVGLGLLVVSIGNLMFLGGGIFVLVVAFLSWRRGNRAAGWFPDLQHRSREPRSARCLGRSADRAGRQRRLCRQAARPQPHTGRKPSRGVADSTTLL